VSRRLQSHAARATAYARRVVAGKIPACRWVKRACQRHLDDLAHARTKAFPFRFDAAKAERACRFAELMPHVKGHWALPVKGKTNRIRLEPWQSFRRSMVFGWVEKGTGLRRFREAYTEVPRKNAKSTDAAIDGLYCFAADGEFGAEVYSGAVTEKQAWEVFRPAKQMAERTPEFRERFGVEVHAKNLSIAATGSRFEPVIGKPGDGASPSLSITDEYHEHPDSTQYDTMVTGMGARRQPLALVITTAGDNIGGPCYAMRDRVQKMLEGLQADERLFGIIYTIDEGDDWTTEAALRKANPNYDVSVSGAYLLAQQQKAIASSREQGIFKTKHLNVWVTARDAWMNMEWWHRAADPGLRAGDLAGEPCAVGADLASRLDLTSVIRVFTRTVDGVPHYFAFGRHYAPRATVHAPANQHYRGWERDGRLIVTDGTDTDYERAADDLMADATTQGLDTLSVDPWNARALTDPLKRAGLEESKIIEVPQRVQYLSPAMKDLEAAVKAGRFHHDGDPVLAWAISNVTVREDPNGNIFPRKDRPENKIDPAVALILAMGRAVITPEVSVYETRGPLLL
jgi:phage terminase large subunit-like protein